MANYDFRSRSPHDFELLCRDLLQRPLGVMLEMGTKLGTGAAHPEVVAP